MKIKKAFKDRTRVQFKFDFEKEPSRTQQHMKDECDINKIIKRWSKTGVLDHVNSAPARYEFCPRVDYQESLDLCLRAEEQFSRLPANIRDRFRNDIPSFLDFVQDPNNYDEGVKLGIFKKNEEVKAPETEGAEVKD